MMTRYQTKYDGVIFQLVLKKKSLKTINLKLTQLLSTNLLIFNCFLSHFLDKVFPFSLPLQGLNPFYH